MRLSSSVSAPIPPNPRAASIVANNALTRTISLPSPARTARRRARLVMVFAWPPAFVGSAGSGASRNHTSHRRAPGGPARPDVFRLADANRRGSNRLDGRHYRRVEWVEAPAPDDFPRRNVLVAKVTMPQLGESVAEGTIGKWLKKPGHHVAKYEPLLEVI